MPESYFYGKCYGEHVCEVSGPSENFREGESQILVHNSPL